MSFDQPSCMRCNEHNNKLDFILDVTDAVVTAAAYFAANGLDGESLKMFRGSHQ